MKRTKIALSLIAVAAFLVGLSHSLNSTQSAVLDHSAIQADYPVYPGVAELADSSDLVAVIQIKERLASRRLIPSNFDLNSLPPYKAANFGPVVSDARAVVSEVLRGTGTLNGETIVVSEVGGALNKRSYIDPQQPLSLVGEQYLVFLEVQDDGTYSILGGGQGRFHVEGGTLTSVSGSGNSGQPVVQDLDGSTMNAMRTLLTD